MSCIFLLSEQGSESWLEDRKGIATASMFSTARGKYKSGENKGEPLKAAKDYAFKLAFERLSGELLDDPQFNPWQAKRGNALESIARLTYMHRKGVLVAEAGLAVTEDRLFGASVDGLIDDDGSLEIKCFLQATKLSEILIDGVVNEDVMDQVQGGLWITGRKWCDFALFCPALKKIGRDLTVIRIYRDEEYIYQLESDLIGFNRLVEWHMQKLVDCNNSIEIENTLEEEISAIGLFGSN